MLAHKAELIALTKILGFGASKKINIYTESRYAFATAHVHRAIYQKSDYSQQREKKQKHMQEMLDHLDALMKLATLSIIHCQGHQKGSDSVA
jgi:fructose/tagatose bisphosphate aldolase